MCFTCGDTSGFTKVEQQEWLSWWCWCCHWFVASLSPGGQCKLDHCTPPAAAGVTDEDLVLFGSITLAGRRHSGAELSVPGGCTTFSHFTLFQSSTNHLAAQCPPALHKKRNKQRPSSAISDRLIDQWWLLTTSLQPVYTLLVLHLTGHMSGRRHGQEATWL